MIRSKAPLLMLLVCWLLTAAGANAQPKWLHTRTEHFEVYSSAKERETREAVNYFEQVRSFFLLNMGAPPADPVPVYIVMFGTPKEYEPYKFNEFASAYYQSGADRDYIVLGKTGEETAQAAVHEYVHLVARHLRLNFPPWLSEGIADLYSTLHVVGGTVEFGNPMPGRLAALRAEKWIPLSTILTADQSSPYYNETKKAGSLYSESWALTHMLATTPEYLPGFDKLQSTIHRGTPSIQALEQIYGKPLAKIELELRNYIVTQSFRRLVQKAELDVSTQADPVERANMFDVRLAWANLLNRQATQQQAKARLEELAKDDTTRPEPWAGLAYISVRENNPRKAVEQFAKAYELGDRSAQMLWDYGRLAESSRPDDAQRALADLIRLQPRNIDAKIELAIVRNNQKQYKEALEALTGITNVNPVQAPRFFSVLALAQTSAGLLQEARGSVARLEQNARTTADRDRAEQLTKYLDQMDRREAGRQAAATHPELFDLASAALDTPDPASRPKLVRAPSAGAKPAAEVLQIVEGQLVATECDDVPTMILETAKGRKSFQLLFPEKLIISGKPSNMQCGTLDKPMKLTIDFTLLPDSKADGVVRALHFPE